MCIYILVKRSANTIHAVIISAVLIIRVVSVNEQCQCE